MAKAKAAEALASLGSIGRLAAAAYDRETTSSVLTPGAASDVHHELCASAKATVPASVTDVSGKKYQSGPTEWTSDSADAGFTCLKFSIDVPQYYAYGYTRSGTGSKLGDTFTATAEGDLDGNGKTSRFEITGTVGPGDAVTVTWKLKESNPEE